MVLLHDNIVGIDSSIFMHPTIWKASGHVDAFNDPLIDNRDSKKRYRADVLIEEQMAKYEEKIAKEIAKAQKKFGDAFDEKQFRETNPRVLENQKKFDDLHARYSEAMNKMELEQQKTRDLLEEKRLREEEKLLQELRAKYEEEINAQEKAIADKYHKQEEIKIQNILSGASSRKTLKGRKKKS